MYCATALAPLRPSPRAHLGQGVCAGAEQHDADVGCRGGLRPPLQPLVVNRVGQVVAGGQDVGLRVLQGRQQVMCWRQIPGQGMLCLQGVPCSAARQRQAPSQHLVHSPPSPPQHMVHSTPSHQPPPASCKAAGCAATRCPHLQEGKW